MQDIDQSYRTHISFDPYINKGFGVRFGEPFQPKPLSKRELIVNRVRVHSLKAHKKKGLPNFIKINVKLAGAQLQPMK